VCQLAGASNTFDCRYSSLDRLSAACLFRSSSQPGLTQADWNSGLQVTWVEAMGVGRAAVRVARAMGVGAGGVSVAVMV
jgi:hypothetical protein